MFEVLKTVHVASVAVSGLFFALRGGIMFFRPTFMGFKPVRRVAEGIDSFLFLSGAGLIWVTDQLPWQEGWLGIKLILLLFYILLGMVAFHWAKGRAQKAVAWIAALAIFSWMIVIALAKSPWPFSG